MQRIRNLLLLSFMLVSSAYAQQLQPPAAALRVADKAQLSGTELGTMWTFENPPLTYWQKQYGFAPTKEWLEHARLASVRYGEYCSASFVSPNGLVITNHHCARECVEANSQQGKDYVVSGFYAASRAEEKLCPGLFLDQLVDIQNVTPRVQAAAKGASDTAIANARARVIEQIQNECAEQTKLNCQVVTLFNGGQFQLYKYKRYSPVKLVFAPELQAGFFGGDPDNFTYPRYDLDFSVVRAYEADGANAAATPHYFQWRTDAAKDGDLVFVTGNPGSTSRQITVSAMMYEREFKHPFIIQYLRAQRDLLEKIGARGPQQEQAVREQLFEVSNSLKAYEGQYSGLQDTMLLGQKVRWERELRSRINANPTWKAKYGDVWDKIMALQLQKMRLSPRLNLSNAEWLGAPQLAYANALVLAARGTASPQTQQMLQSNDAPDAEVAQGLLNAQLQMIARWLPANDSLRQQFIRAGESPEQAAARIAGTSKILDAQFRQQLLSGGVNAVQASQDPAVQLALAMLKGRDKLQQQWDQITAAETVQQARLAQAGFAAFGANIPPDATFTLRISDGVVKGYPYNGTLAPTYTTYFGIFDRSASFRNQMPFTLPAAYEANRSNIDMSTALDFVTTNDITGGNSGSPIVDRDGHIVGLAFDGNIESLPNEFLYQNTLARTVGVSSAGITEALRNIYHADALLKELMGAK